MAYENAITPGRIGNLEIKNRISLPPLEKNWCDRLGNPTRRFIDYYVERAKHGVGSITFEATYIDARGRGNLFQLGLWHDDNIAAHKRLNAAVQDYGCRTSAELNHGGRNANTHRTGLQPAGPSNIPLPMVGGHELRELSADEIAAIIQSFKDGARRSAEAGYDMITIHAAHGYLITSFLSPIYNRRTDSYGGSEENRQRFALEIYRAIRDEVGAEFPVGIRVSAEEGIKGGYGISSTIGLANRLASMGLDFVDVSTGVYESIEDLIQPMDMAQGCLLPLARQMKEAVQIPVFAAGRIASIELADRAISNGDCDFVHMGRAFHADPELLSKSLEGRRNDVVGCIACNKCCMELFVNKPSVCTVNVAAGRERKFKLTQASNLRSIMVAGGGMAGMEAARVAAERGHEVTLYEKTDQLGGWINVLSAPRNRNEWARAIFDRERLCEQAGVEIVLGKEVDEHLLREKKPAALIAATGTRPFIPKYLPGYNEFFVTNYDDLARGRIAPGFNVVVVGGQQIGMAIAEYLAEAGARVTVVEATGSIAADLEFMAQKTLTARLAKNDLVDIRLNTNVEAIHPDGVLLQSGGKTQTLADIDQVVFALERDMNQDLEEIVSDGLLDELGTEFLAVGDCVWPGEPYDAVLSGYMAAASL